MVDPKLSPELRADHDSGINVAVPGRSVGSCASTAAINGIVSASRVLLAANTTTAISALSEKLVEFVVRAEPNPFDRLAVPFSDCANIQIHPHRPIGSVAPEFFELERVVGWIVREETERTLRRSFASCG